MPYGPSRIRERSRDPTGVTVYHGWYSEGMTRTGPAPARIVLLPIATGYDVRRHEGVLIHLGTVGRVGRGWGATSRTGERTGHGTRRAAAAHLGATLAPLAR